MHLTVVFISNVGDVRKDEDLLSQSPKTYGARVFSFRATKMTNMASCIPYIALILNLLLPFILMMSESHQNNVGMSAYTYFVFIRTPFPELNHSRQGWLVGWFGWIKL
jgi:hypothetical protein